MKLPASHVALSTQETMAFNSVYDQIDKNSSMSECQKLLFKADRRVAMLVFRAAVTIVEHGKV